MSRYPYIDRNPCIIAAGKPLGDPYANVKDLLQNITLQDKVDAIRKQFGFVDTKDYSAEWVKGPDRGFCGALTEAGMCLRGPINTQFQALDEEVKNTIYDSYWNKPLGKGRDQTPGLPKGMNPLEVTFGKKINPVNGSHVINPPLKAEHVRAEDMYYHHLYAFTHNNYYPGEQIKRDYAPPYNIYNYYGRPSKKDESGDRVKRALTWFNNDPISNVSRRQAAVRNRTLPPLGKALDKTGVTDLFPVDHTYGKPTNADFYGVEDLLNECTPSLVRRDMLHFLGYANKLRQSVYQKTNAGEIVLEELFDEISNLNKNKDNENTCTVHFDCIDRILKRHRIYLDRPNLEPLLLMLGILKESGEIHIRDFINFIDRNSRFPDLKKEHYILPPEFQEYSDQFCSEFENQEEKFYNLFLPRAGKPTCRLDKNYPAYVDTLANQDHLGEETTARALISPSIYTQYGLSHRDFFMPRSKSFLQKLFKKINVNLSEEELDEIYKEGYELDKTGGVCVETFRNVLDKRAFSAYNKIE